MRDRLEHLLDALPRLARGEQDILVPASDQVDHLVLHLVDHGRIHVDLVQHGDDLQVVPDGQVEVRDRLGLDALRGVHHEQRPFARGDGARDFVREIDVSRGVDQVERVAFAVAGRVFHLYGVALDGDALFALEVHVVEHLRLHFALVQGVGLLQQAVCEGRFAVVDVGYDAEVADVFHEFASKNTCKYTKYILNSAKPSPGAVRRRSAAEILKNFIFGLALLDRNTYLCPSTGYKLVRYIRC